MNKKERVQLIMHTLQSLFPNPTIPLTHIDPYTLLVATVLSAQCTDTRVNQVTPQLFAQAKTPEEMIQLPIATIQTTIKSCGLSHVKARAIWHLSMQLIEKYGGEVPDHLASLETLPGVGHKTASVVISQAFGKPAFPVDTHIHRCAQRWGLSSGKNVRTTEKDLKRSFPKNQWNHLHLQMIYFARQYCPARGHVTHHCPICSKLCQEIGPTARASRICAKKHRPSLDQ